MNNFTARACAILLSAIGVGASLPAMAAEPAQPALSESASLVATIASVKGLVQIRDAEDLPWRTAAVGMTLPIGGEVRTTPRAAIALILPPDQIVTVDRLTTLKILDAMKNSNGFKTDLGMKYGRVSYDVEAAGLQHEAIIRAPSSALAVRGTNVLVTDDAFGSNIILCKGLADATTQSGSIRMRRDENGAIPSTQPFDKPSVYFDRLDPSTQINCINIDDTSLSIADYNLSITKDPTSKRTIFSSSEINVSSSLPVSLIGQSQSWQPGGSIETHGLGFESTPDVGEGVLSFLLTWFGDGSGQYTDYASARKTKEYEGPVSFTPDLDLTVFTPSGQAYTPGETAQKFGKVSVSANHRGGTASSTGSESVSWSDSCPVGKYTYAVHYVGSGEPATFTIEILLNGKKINAFFDDTLTELDPDASYAITIPPANSPESLAAAKAKSKAKAVKSPVKPAKPVKTVAKAKK